MKTFMPLALLLAAMPVLAQDIATLTADTKKNRAARCPQGSQCNAGGGR